MTNETIVYRPELERTMSSVPISTGRQWQRCDVMGFMELTMMNRRVEAKSIHLPTHLT